MEFRDTRHDALRAGYLPSWRIGTVPGSLREITMMVPRCARPRRARRE
jgi:hypothetical protein